MHTGSPFNNDRSAIALPQFSQIFNNKVVALTLAFWLSSSLLLDVVVMPCLYATGMMSTSGFASAGQQLFGLFNRLELLCAATVLTAMLSRRQTPKLEASLSLGGLGLPLVLLAIGFAYTYGLTPQMAGLGMNLNFLTQEPAAISMNWMHVSYWMMEVLKFTVGGVLLNRCFRQPLV
jgi:Domain of unknown function (DUF4149)